MKKLAILLAAVLMVLPAVVPAQNLDKVQRPDDRGRYGRPGIEVWTDNNDGVYYEGENVTVYFRADRDCYVAIYGVDTRGDVNLLFPAARWDDGYVRGGEVYAIPGDNADYDLVINGPEGMEIIQAIASDEELDIPDWFNGAPIHCDYRDDRDEFINYINDRYFDCRFGNCDRAFDRTTLYVKVPRYYYKPVHVPTYWDTYPDYTMMYIDYPFGGEIYIDGIFFGIAPLWIPRVIYGHHWFTIYDRYGYCWEDQIIIDHHTTIRLDQSRVKTSRTVVSRYVDKDIRAQAKKFDRTSFVKSEERVKSVRANSSDMASKRASRPGVATDNGSRTNPRGKTSGDSPNRTGSKKYEGDSRRTTSDWNTPRPSTGKKGGDRTGTYDKSETGKKGGDGSGTYDRSEPSKRSTPNGATPKYSRPSGPTKPKGEATPSRSGTVKSSGSSQSSGSRSTGSTSKGSSSNNTGSTKKGSGGGDKSGSGKRP